MRHSSFGLAMPIHILASAFVEGLDTIPGLQYVWSYGPLVALVVSMKYYFAGARNNWDLNLHGKVYIVTGGTSGLGASIVKELATRGAQVVFLVRNLSDGWLIEHIDKLRDEYGNQLLFAEECDLSSLHSIRKFATLWLNNQTPRRLDGIILAHGESLPIGKPREVTVDGVEKHMAVNYLATFHLLTLMAPAVRSQPTDRRVKVLAASCLSQVFGSVDLDDLLWQDKKYPTNRPWKIFGSAKLLQSCFIKEYQRRLDSYKRSDKTEMSVRCNLVNPGMMRSTSTKRFLSFGSVFGLLLYVVMYPVLWVFLKSTHQGAQTFFYALMNPELELKRGGNFLKECSIVKGNSRKELGDEELQKKVYDKTEKLIADLEKNSARERNKRDKKSKKKKQEPKVPKVDEETRLKFLKDKIINDELNRIDTLPLLGEFKPDQAKTSSEIRDNKYLRDLDEKFARARLVKK